MAFPASKFIPGIGKTFKIAAAEIQPGVLVGTLTADAEGRESDGIADAFFDAATVARTFGDDAFTTAVIFQLFDTNGIDKTTADEIVAAGAFARSKLAADALAKHGVPLNTIWQPTGIPHDATGGAGVFSIERATGVLTLEGEVCDNTTKTDIAYFEYVLPDNYKAGGLITIRVACAQISSSGVGTGVTGTTSDIAMTVIKQAHGAVGADLVASGSPQTFAAMDTWYDKDVVVTPTGLVPGDKLQVQITTRSIDSNAGAGSIQSEISEVIVLHDVQG